MAKTESRIRYRYEVAVLIDPNDPEQLAAAPKIEPALRASVLESDEAPGVGLPDGAVQIRQLGRGVPVRVPAPEPEPEPALGLED